METSPLQLKSRWYTSYWNAFYVYLIKFLIADPDTADREI